MVLPCWLLSQFIPADFLSLELTYNVRLYQHSAHFLNCLHIGEGSGSTKFSAPWNRSMLLSIQGSDGPFPQAKQVP